MSFLIGLKKLFMIKRVIKRVIKRAIKRVIKRVISGAIKLSQKTILKNKK